MSEIGFYDTNKREVVIYVDHVITEVINSESCVTFLYEDTPIFTKFLPLHTMNGRTAHIHTPQLKALAEYDGRVFPFGYYNHDDHSEFQYLRIDSWMEWTRYIFSRIIKDGGFDSIYGIDPVRSLTVKYVWKGGKIQEPPLYYASPQFEKKRPNPFTGFDFFNDLTEG